FLDHGCWWVCLLLYGVIMNRGFLDSRGRNNNHRKKINAVDATGSFMESGGNLINVNPLKEVVSPSVTNVPVVMEMQSPVVDKTNAVNTDVGSYPPLPTQGTTPIGNILGKSSYAKVIGESSRKAVNFRTLFTPRGNGVDVVVLVELIQSISERFVNTTYGFFLGKRVAYPVVDNYVRNTWGKFGLVKSMLNSSNGLFSFQFSSMDGLNSMLENGPWFIRNHPLILCKWNPDVDLLKEDVGNVPVWVKLHGVPVTAFSEDGLSAIATKIGTPLMLDSYTSDMCLQSWGRSSYARAMIELRADVELKDTIVVAMPKIMEEWYYTCTVRVEYEWKPPSQTSRGVPIGPKVGFKPHKEYRPVLKKATANSRSNKKKGVEPTNEISNSNPFDNVDNSITSTTLTIDKIGKYENQIIDGQATLVDEADNPLKRDSYGNGNYDDDPYDDDMYEGRDISEEIQTICDNLDIRVRGRKKK
ncbi:putative reverse transcriptase domain-containing protein, partial [Tanacetum coccineum]